MKRQQVAIAILLAFSCLLPAKSRAQLGIPPIIAVQPLGIGVQNGGTAVLTTTAVSLTSMQFQWYLNGKKIKVSSDATVVNVAIPLVGTISTLTVSGVDSSVAGIYSVQIQNAIGKVTSSNAVVVVLTSTVSNVLSIVSGGSGMTTNGFKLQLSGPAGSNYVIQASTDLTNWTAIATNAAPTGSITYTDPAARNMTFRYYRALVQ